MSRRRVSVHVGLGGGLVIAALAVLVLPLVALFFLAMWTVAGLMLASAYTGRAWRRHTSRVTRHGRRRDW